MNSWIIAKIGPFMFYGIVRIRFVIASGVGIGRFFPLGITLACNLLVRGLCYERGRLQGPIRKIVGFLEHELGLLIRITHFLRTDGPKFVETSRTIEVVINESFTREDHILAGPFAARLEVIPNQDAYLTTRLKFWHGLDDFCFRHEVHSLTER